MKQPCGKSTHGYHGLLSVYAIYASFIHGLQDGILPLERMQKFPSRKWPRHVTVHGISKYTYQVYAYSESYLMHVAFNFYSCLFSLQGDVCRRYGGDDRV
jgi:hypothetical protein